MSITMSIITSIAIAIAVWFLVWLQPAASAPDTALTSIPVSKPAEQAAEVKSFEAVKAQQQTSKASQAQKPAQSVVEEEVKQAPIALVGLKRRIKLSAVDALWQEFSDNQHLQRSLIRNRFEVYAVYNNFTDSFIEADVLIGYQRSALNDAVRVTGTLPTATGVELLKSDQHSPNQLAQAWQDIDYSRAIVAVIERHQIGGEQDLVSLSVIYQD